MSSERRLPIEVLLRWGPRRRAPGRRGRSGDKDMPGACSPDRPTVPARTRPTTRRGFAAPSPAVKLRLLWPSAILRLLEGVRGSEPEQGCRLAPVRILVNSYCGAGQYPLTRKEGGGGRRRGSGPSSACVSTQTLKPRWKRGSRGNLTRSHPSQRQSGSFSGRFLVNAQPRSCRHQGTRGVSRSTPAHWQSRTPRSS
jgi:hypothetical protein